MAELVYRPVIRTALAVFGALDLRFNLEGIEHIPADGAAVLAANHVSYLDFTFVGFAAHRRGRLVRFLAKKSVFDSRISGPLMRGMHHIPVDRSAGVAAYRLAVEALGAGELVGIFPEATISRSFVPREFRRGAARLAIESGTPLLPVVIWGGQRIWTSGHRPRFVRHVPVTIRVGAPLGCAAGDDPKAVTDRLRQDMLGMVEQVQRDYPERPAAGEEWWLPAHLGGSAPSPIESAAAEVAAINGRRNPA